jgi:hypothetical protein
MNVPMGGMTIRFFTSMDLILIGLKRCSSLNCFSISPSFEFYLLWNISRISLNFHSTFSSITRRSCRKLFHVRQRTHGEIGYRGETAAVIALDWTTLRFRAKKREIAVS